MYTDNWFLLGAHEAIKLHLKYGNQPIYYYLFGYRGVISFSAAFGDPVNDYGKEGSSSSYCISRS